MAVELYIEDVFTYVSGAQYDLECIENLLRFWDEGTKYREQYRDQYNYLFFDESSGKLKGKFYTGLVPYILNTLNDMGVDVEIRQDSSLLRRAGHIARIPNDYLDGITLRDYQLQVIRAAIYKQRGILQLPARSGKTEICAAIIKFLDLPTLVVTHTTNLLHQTVARFNKRGLGPVGYIGERREKGNGKVTVGMVQTLASGISKGDEEIYELFKDIGVVFFDEVHHLKAPTWMLVGELCLAKYRYGLSATPFVMRNKSNVFEDMALIGLTGDVIAKVSSSSLVTKGYLTPPRVYFIPVRSPKITIPAKVQDNKKWHYVYTNGVVSNSARNKLFLDIVKRMYDNGMKVLVLVSRKDHGKNFIRMLLDAGIDKEHCIFAMGQSTVYRLTVFGPRDDRWPFERVRSFVEQRERCVVIGTQVMDEGVDLPSIDATINMAAMRSFKQTIQRSTRSMTADKGKHVAWVVDALDLSHGWLTAQSMKRKNFLSMEFPDAPIIDNLEQLIRDLGELHGRCI